MIRIIFNIFFIFLILVNVCGTASNTYFKKDAIEMQGIDEFIKQRNGNITWSGEALKYNVEVNGHKAVIDFSSDKNVKNTMSTLFPDVIFIKFTFFKVFPDADIFIEKRKYGRTDKSGNFNDGSFFDTQAGLHHIQLIKNNEVVTKAELNILSENDVSCIGETEMQCKQALP